MNYLTVEKEARAEFTEQKSRFICHIKPVETENEANEFISGIKQKYWDAKHNVYAYILKDGNIKKFSDDGEPHSTAGLPMLQTMDKKQLVNCVAVVTRYFGGVLLGTGGLVRAYSGCVSLGIEAAGIIEMVDSFKCSFTCPYESYGKFENLIKGFTVKIENTEFNENVKVTFFIGKEGFLLLEKKITDIFFGKLKLEKQKECFEYYKI